MCSCDPELESVLNSSKRDHGKTPVPNLHTACRVVYCEYGEKQDCGAVSGGGDQSLPTQFSLHYKVRLAYPDAVSLLRRPCPAGFHGTLDSHSKRVGDDLNFLSREMF
jgi:hypothetical protein